jgi:hypothetical protein
MSTTFVFAGNFNEFRQFCADNDYSTHDPEVVFVATPETFQGRGYSSSAPTPQVVVTGGFWDRTDAHEISTAALAIGVKVPTTHTSPNS